MSNISQTSNKRKRDCITSNARRENEQQDNMLLFDDMEELDISELRMLEGGDISWEVI